MCITLYLDLFRVLFLSPSIAVVRPSVPCFGMDVGWQEQEEVTYAETSEVGGLQAWWFRESVVDDYD